jgi:Uma2 family endonuclease
VDPDARTLEVHRLHDDGHWLLLNTLQKDDPVKQPPFDAITFGVGSLRG